MFLWPQKTRCFMFLIWVLFVATGGADAQSMDQPKTDPSEALALRSMFDLWKSSSPFLRINRNADDDICHASNNSRITCDCSFNKSTTCHVTELEVANFQIAAGISRGLRNLTKLKKLEFQENYFKGSLPEFIGNLNELEHLNLGSNLFSGTIPKELGRLQNLSYLNIGINNFSGLLPDELGNLSNLRELRINSIGVNGSFPSTFENLKKLETLWISDNNFTGEIPGFIGSFLQLKDLRLQGNSFHGPIPPSFSYLVKLEDLRIGEIKGSSGLLDIQNMRFLKRLILRNCNISGTIPSDFGSNKTLKYLDLSFNNLSGPVPETLFNMPSLQFLSLGNNHLQGPLPSRKLSSIFIDLSYNDLAGNFPTWVNGSYNLNLVANNFTDDSGDSDFSGLRCLQKDFPCHRNSSRNVGFAINSGGSPVRTSNGIFERDNVSLEEIPYKMQSEEKWAVVSSGKFLDVTGPTYFQSFPVIFEGTQNPQLFKHMRLSPSSLRYYGLGLKNGSYNVRLYFGETIDYWDIRKGRRLFDIYIQGSRVAEDFDISKKAHGSLKTAVEFNYKADVFYNFLEIHLFWAGKGTCCIPNRISYGPSIAAVRVTLVSDFNTVPSEAKSKFPLIVGLSATFILLMASITGMLIWRWRRRLKAYGATVVTLFMASITGMLIWRRRRRLKVYGDLLALGIKPKFFDYKELKIATGDFGEANKLGQGGFGSVFKGTLSDGSEVAIKKLAVSSVEGKTQFITEVATVSVVQHRNLVKLLGWCCEVEKRLLIYEYLSNKSLDKVLFGKTNLQLLDWEARFRICLGTARGLAYLHEESSIRMIHRDVKASNILLDQDLNPKISDFGLAKPYDHKMTHISTRVAGTAGYLAPEYALRGQLTEKADVFGFGVVAFEILSGKPNSLQCPGGERNYLLDWAWKLHENNRDLEILDGRLAWCNQEEALRVIGVAFMCTQASATKRPIMSRVVAMLIGDMETVEVLNRPSYLVDFKCSNYSSSTQASTNYVSSVDEKDYHPAP